jgi:hypothetical protein
VEKHKPKGLACSFTALRRAFAQKAAHLDGLLCAAHQANQQQRRTLNRGIDSYRNLQAVSFL